VGSRAHNLHNEDSDYDYRGVYVLPTTEILSIGYKYKGSNWLEGEKEDQTSWEIGHFLHLATKCNPTILEVFKSPVIETLFSSKIKANELLREHNWGDELRALFPYIWNPKDAFNAFTGYGLNQRKKMLDNKDNRWQKYEVAYIRTLYNLTELLRTNDFSVEVTNENVRKELINIKDGKVKLGEIVDMAKKLEYTCQELLLFCTNTPNIDKVNEFLIMVRKEFWE